MSDRCNHGKCGEICGSVYAKAGLRHTRQRHDVLGVLSGADAPLTAGDIYERLKTSGSEMNLTTVYRTLETLEKYDVLNKVSIESDISVLYELNDSNHRHYLICTDCKRIQSLPICPIKDFEAIVALQTDYIISGHSLNVYGICPECSRNTNK